MMTERHFTAQELAALWKLSPASIRRLFRDEPGVLKMGAAGRRDRRDFVSLRIPESVAERVYAARVK